MAAIICIMYTIAQGCPEDNPAELLQELHGMLNPPEHIEPTITLIRFNMDAHQVVVRNGLLHSVVILHLLCVHFIRLCITLQQGMMCV